ncbi:M50 family metallopeptidase [Bacillus songklensis]|uniref:M50 family metallopeptidase n=1 Tax=Bacillus songklensis TaxID=1069116 RepID=A0ABV8AYL8_9BACI
MSKILFLLTNIHIHPLFWAVFGIGIVTAHFQQLVILFFIVLIHELGHAAAASFFSWRIKRIMLLPFGGVAEVEEHGNRPFREELIVIISGPLTHLVLMAISYVLVSFSIISYELHQQFIVQNMMILGFNLLPIWPLDGGKLLFLFFTRTLPFLQAYKKMLYASGSLLAGLLLFSAFFYFQQLHLWMVLGFLGFSIYHEWRHRQYVYLRFLLDRYHSKERNISQLKPLLAAAGDPIQHVLEQFQRGCKHVIIVRNKENEQIQLDENELLHAYFVERRLHAPIEEVIPFY